MTLRERAAKNIIDRRKNSGLSQEGLARQAGLSRSYVGKIENARFSMTIDPIEKIAHALDVDADVLCQSARNLDPLSASKNDPLGAHG